MKKLLQRLTAVFFVLVLCLTPASALTVEEAIELLKVNYIDELPAAAYEATTLDELFAALGDPYTFYMDGAEYQEFTSIVESESTVTGIGATIEYTAEGILLTSVLPGSGAEEAGLKADDVIIAVEDVSCVPAGEQHRSMILGEAGTHVNVTVRHPDGSTQVYSIERRTLVLYNTNASLSGDGIVYIDCNSFGSNTADRFDEGIEAYREDARIWIVDLRNNIGGYADAAASALGAFTGPGPKIYYRLNDGSTYYTLYLADRSTDKPVIVLVDGRSASASEILSSGIRAEGAGIVIGSRTYGKGSAQILLDKEKYPDYFGNDSIKVTAYRFYCSDGNTTDRLGVLPTLLVSNEYAEAVAWLLTARSPESGDYLRLTLNSCEFCVDLAEATSGENAPAFAELLSALPPDAEAALVRAGGEEETVSSAELLARYGEAAVSRRFTDVSDSPYAAELDTLGTYGIVLGVGDGSFSPDAELTRAELCAMLAQALNVSARSSGAFSDVAEDAWYAGSVAAIARLGFIDGVADGVFAPDETLTQEQFIAIMGRLARFLNFNVDDYARALTEDDLAADEELAPFASWAREGVCVLTCCADGSMLYAERSEIDPNAAVTREQAAATLCRMFKVLDILVY